MILRAAAFIIPVLLTEEVQSQKNILLIRLIWLVLIIIGASLLYLAYHKWIVPKHIKDDTEYQKNKYKNIDGC